MSANISMATISSRVPKGKFQSAQVSVSYCSVIRHWIILILIIFSTWVIVYLPLQYSMKIHPRPDISWMFDQQNMTALVQPHISTSLKSPSSCLQDVFVLIVVFSAVKNFDQRQAIRDTWGKANRTVAGVRVVFLVGTLLFENDTRSLDELDIESHKFGDILQEDFVDSYNNLTVKSVMMLKWVTEHCNNSRFVMKTDDDMFVNVPNLIKELRKARDTRLLLGCLIAKASPIKDWSSKWYAPNDIFSRQVYPDYLSGTGYVMSGDTVPILYKIALQMHFFYLEDVFVTGLCAEKAGFKRLNNNNFKFYKRKNNVCVFRNLITGHRMSINELKSIWLKVNNLAIKCIQKPSKKANASTPNKINKHT